MDSHRYHFIVWVWGLADCQPLVLYSADIIVLSSWTARAPHRGNWERHECYSVTYILVDAWYSFSVPGGVSLIDIHILIYVRVWNFEPCIEHMHAFSESFRPKESLELLNGLYPLGLKPLCISFLLKCRALELVERRRDYLLRQSHYSRSSKTTSCRVLTIRSFPWFVKRYPYALRQTTNYYNP